MSIAIVAYVASCRVSAASTGSRVMSSYQACPVDEPQPPNRQLICSSVASAWKTVDTSVQSSVPDTAGVRTACMFWMLSSAPTAP